MLMLVEYVSPSLLSSPIQPEELLTETLNCMLMLFFLCIGVAFSARGDNVTGKRTHSTAHTARTHKMQKIAPCIELGEARKSKILGSGIGEGSREKRPLSIT